MAALVYKDAVILIGGYDITAELNELSIELGAEMLDATVFGSDTRINRGGLKTGKFSMGGLATFASDLAADVVFENVGADNSQCAVFPAGVTEGSPTGYAMRGVIGELTIGGAVGVLTPFTFAIDHQGAM